VRSHIEIAFTRFYTSSAGQQGQIDVEIFGDLAQDLPVDLAGLTALCLNFADNLICIAIKHLLAHYESR